MKGFTLIAVLLIISGCQKEDLSISFPELPLPKQEAQKSDFIQMKFVFVNHGDVTLQAINLESWFYRIHSNNSKFLYKNYPSVSSHDSIIHFSDSSKIGSQKKFDVQLNFYKNGIITKRLRYLSALSADTIKKPEDGIEIFRWPEDTINYIKISQWP